MSFVDYDKPQAIRRLLVPGRLIISCVVLAIAFTSNFYQIKWSPHFIITSPHVAYILDIRINNFTLHICEKTIKDVVYPNGDGLYVGYPTIDVSKPAFVAKFSWLPTLANVDFNFAWMRCDFFRRPISTFRMMGWEYGLDLNLFVFVSIGFVAASFFKRKSSPLHSA